MTAPGVVLSHRYRLTNRIAIGGMGEVWAADDIRLARVVACKILRPELTGDPEFLGRFRAEARITASLNHPGICAVYDYGEVSGANHYLTGTAYLVMELITGESLSSVLNRLGRLSAGRTLDVLEQTGHALQQAHARALVHRDIKPGNLLITPGGQVKVTDFGIAKVAHEAPVTRSGMVMGTAQYISPEQAAGRDASPASDIYSLGVVAYECLVGRLPFHSDNTVAIALAHVREAPPPLPDDVPPPVARLVMTMLAKDPAARFPQGEALAMAAARLRMGGPDFSPPRSRPAPRPTLIAPTAVPTAAAAAGPGPAAGAGRAVPSASPRGVAPARAVAPTQAPPPWNRPVAPPPHRPPGRPVGRRTGLSLLLALLVLVLAGLALVVLNAVFGAMAV
ncbi:MAG TPA: serine/threonine-protein kinase [Nakamurella sp.]